MVVERFMVERLEEGRWVLLPLCFSLGTASIIGGGAYGRYRVYKEPLMEGAYQNPLTDKEWDTFFELMDKITNGPGAWVDKAKGVNKEADKRDSDTALHEFSEWFGE
jgi:hypothetical protein